ncbi:MAG TPA: tRNA uridine-5-carboxymethylaminomethyl(34) synthesis GTPase MnmE [Firmicutes bacterium]|nr:tRNA uridine-5-carboxymethylaminomethyl(34) synthesis GTPase MnmE [Bacillota bacterium]
MLGETIAAISTAPGTAAIGIVRLSGPAAIPIAGKMFRPAKVGGALAAAENRRLILGTVRDEHNHPLDECLAVVMRAPHSYTGEDLVELHCHGSPVVLRQVLTLAIAYGAKPAGPGEFTKRAFINGKLDLLQVEAVGDLLAAGSSGAAAVALGQLRGELSRKIEAAKNRLQRFLVHLQAAIDYPEEVEEITPEELLDQAKEVEQEIRALLKEAERGQRVREGVSVVLAGKPNTGKSSLMNRLLQSERSIVADIPGTTRDVVEESVEIAGVAFRLSDTAGIRRSGELIEQIGIKKAQEAIERAHLILAVFDGAAPFTADDAEVLRLIRGKPVLAVINKHDLPQVLDRGLLSPLPVVEVSALTGFGLEELEQAMLRQTGLEDVGLLYEQSVISRPRQKGALAAAAMAMKNFLQGVEEGLTADCLAMDLEEALWQLGSLTGEVHREDIINDIFAQFCVGK